MHQPVFLSAKWVDTTDPNADADGFDGEFLLCSYTIIGWASSLTLSTAWFAVVGSPVEHQGLTKRSIIAQAQQNVFPGHQISIRGVLRIKLAFS